MFVEGLLNMMVVVCGEGYGSSTVCVYGRAHAIHTCVVYGHAALTLYLCGAPSDLLLCFGGILSRLLLLIQHRGQHR